MKSCKFCCEEINRRARVCPICHRNVTILGSASAFFITVLPILTALASLGFAFYEKYERLYVQDTLARTETQLQVTQVQNDVALEAVALLNAITPPAVMAPRNIGNGTAVSPTQQLQQVEQQITDVKLADTIDVQKLKQLERQRLELKSGRSIFRRNR